MKAARSSHLRTLKNEPQNSAPIGIVVDSLGGGGAERIALVVAEGLAAAGHRVDLLLCCNINSFAVIDCKCAFHPTLTVL